MAPHLANLPNETLSLILSQFCLHCTKDHEYDSPDGYFRHSGPTPPDHSSWYSRDYRRPLHSMCLVSRRFLPVAQSILHHEFIPGYGDSWRSTFSWDERLIPFLRTIASRPDLAALVKRIYVNQALSLGITEKEAHNALDEAVRAAAPGRVQICDYLAPFQKLQKRAYFPAKVKYVGPALLGMLLALLPNLERFSFEVGEPWVTIPAAALTALTDISTSRLLPNLKTLDICHRSEGRMFHLHQEAGGILEPVNVTGSLTTLNLHMCNAVAHMGRGNLRNLKTLRLTHSRLGLEDLARLLDSCADSGLTSFTYEAASPQFDRLSGSPAITHRAHFQPSDAIRLLRPHKATLESLHLDLRRQGKPVIHPGGYTDSGWYTTPFSESMRDFPALNHLFLSACSVCNSVEPTSRAADDNELLTRLLPPNITSLYLAGTLGNVTARLANALLHLAKTETVDKQFPKLERVRCDKNMRSVRQYGLNKRGLRTAFAAAGVDYDCDSWSLSEPTLGKGEERCYEEVIDEFEREMMDCGGQGPLPGDDDDL